MTSALPVINRSQRVEVRDFARDQIGDSYKWLGEGPDQWDCSGLTKAAWGTQGIYLPHQAAAQIKRIRGNYTDFDGTVYHDRIGHVHSWSSKSRNGLLLGDLVFVYGDVDEPDSVTHVAVFTGWRNHQRQITAAVSAQYGVIETGIEWGGIPSGVGYIGH